MKRIKAASVRSEQIIHNRSSAVRITSCYSVVSRVDQSHFRSSATLGEVVVVAAVIGAAVAVDKLAIDSIVKHREHDIACGLKIASG